MISCNDGYQFARGHTTPSSYTLHPHFAGHPIASIQFLHQRMHGVKFFIYYKVSPAKKDAAILANVSLTQRAFSELCILQETNSHSLSYDSRSGTSVRIYPAQHGLCDQQTQQIFYDLSKVI